MAAHELSLCSNKNILLRQNIIMVVVLLPFERMGFTQVNYTAPEPAQGEQVNGKGVWHSRSPTGLLEHIVSLWSTSPREEPVSCSAPALTESADPVLKASLLPDSRGSACQPHVPIRTPGTAATPERVSSPHIQAPGHKK